jgi:Tfp pilus assembly protein PilO
MSKGNLEETIKSKRKPQEMKSITLETIYKKVTDLQRDIAQIKKSLLEEPELREDFILRMRDIDLERSIMIDNFENRYELQ